MSTARGRQAEDAAVHYVQSKGFTIIDTNWRTRWCEIDIIAQKQHTTYFIEVKYRKSAAYGSGLEYITPQKLRQMYFAAELWLAKHARTTPTVLLAAIEVTGDDFATGELIIID